MCRFHVERIGEDDRETDSGNSNSDQLTSSLTSSCPDLLFSSFIAIPTYLSFSSLYPSRNTILLATPSSPYLSCSCCWTAGSAESKRLSSQRSQNGPEMWEGFNRRSRAAEKSPLVFNSALVTPTRSWNKNSLERLEMI